MATITHLPASDGVSDREIRRRRRQAAKIVDDVIHQMPPSAGLCRISAAVTTRCKVAGIPAPSRHALVAKIAEVTRSQRSPKMIILDHAIVQVSHRERCSSLATLHVAILDPPMRVLAWHLAGGPYDAAVDARLLVSAQRVSNGLPDTRVSLRPAGQNSDRLRGLLNEAMVDTTIPVERESGRHVQRVLRNQLKPDILRQRRPQHPLNDGWLAGEHLDALRSRIEQVFEVRCRNKATPIPPFGLATPHFADHLIESLTLIGGGSELLAPDHDSSASA